MSAPLLLALLLTTANPEAAPITDPAAAWVRGNTAYNEGRYAEAVRTYEALTAAGWGGGHLWYNLGNAYLRTGQLGPAIASYLRSRASLPRDPDVEANLTFARRSTQDAVPAVTVAPVWRTLFFWHFNLSRSEILFLTVLANVGFWTLLALRLFKPDAESLRWGSWLALALLLMFGGSWAAHWLSPQQIAVIKSAEVDVHTGTGHDTVVQFKLHAGTEARWDERRGEWVRIALPDGKQGWLHQDDVVVLTL